MKTKNFIRNIIPFNNAQEMPTALYIIKKMLAFFLIYGLSAVLGEAIIIGVLSAMGYDPLNGVMPSGHLGELLQYYGFAVFFIVTVLYCKLIEKRKLNTLGFNKKGLDYLFGGAVAILLLAVIIGLCCVSGVLGFSGVATGIDVGYLIALFFAFLIQSLAEETICRGFLLPSLSKKTSLPLAIFVSSTAFALPHLSSLLSADTQFAVVGIINLYLVSVIFSLLFVLRSNIFIVSGLHCVWNFVLNGVMGLSVSGSDSNASGVLNFEVHSSNILNGGVYGLEASIITTVVLGISAVVLAIICHKRGVKNGL